MSTAVNAQQSADRSRLASAGLDAEKLAATTLARKAADFSVLNTATHSTSVDAVTITLSSIAIKTLAAAGGSAAVACTDDQQALGQIYGALAKIINSATSSDAQKLIAYKAFTLDSTVRDNTVGQLNFKSGAADNSFDAAIQNSLFEKDAEAVSQGRSNGSTIESGIAEIFKEARQLANADINGLLSSVSSSVSVSVTSGGDTMVSSSVTQVLANPADFSSTRPRATFDGSSYLTPNSSLPTVEPSSTTATFAATVRSSVQATKAAGALSILKDFQVDSADWAKHKAAPATLVRTHLQSTGKPTL